MNLCDIASGPATAEEFHASVLARLNVAGLRRSVAARARMILERFPQVADSTLAQAELALQGRLVLWGTDAKPYFVGDPPDWFANPVNDEQYTCALNRMYHWRTLLAAFTLSGERRFGLKVVQELRDWIARCPRPSLDIKSGTPWTVFGSATPWRILDAGIRMYESWPWVLEHLLGTELLPPELLAEYARACYVHGELLAELSPAMIPNADHNHYLMENLGLLKLAYAFPELRTSQKWQTQALHELERCATAQLTEDGGQIEACPHYHNGCVYWFCLAWHTARQHGLRFSQTYQQRVRNALRYSLQSFRPSGNSVPWGDSDADHLAISSAGLWGHIAFDDAEPLRVMAGLTGAEAARRASFEIASGCGGAMHLWTVPDLDRVLVELERPATTTPPQVCWQRQLKQVMLRTGWNREALSVFFAACCPMNNGHAHIDPMGFDFTALGRPLVVDPGRFTYREDQHRQAFKSAAWHNTLTINGRDPFEYRGSWSYGPQKEAAILRVIEQPDLLAAEAMQRNYEPALHRRVVALVDATALVVLDWLSDLRSESSVQIYYHLDSTQVTWDAQRHQAGVQAGDIGLMLAATANLHGSLLPGRVSDSMDVARDSTRLLLEDAPVRAVRPARVGSSERAYAAVLVPYRLSQPIPTVKLSPLQQTPGGLLCRFELNGRPYRVQWSEAGLSWTHHHNEES